MNAAEGVAEALVAMAPVTGLVGTRVRMMKLDEGEALPAIRVQLIAERQEMHLRGAVNVFASIVQVDTYAREASGTDAYATARSVDGAIHGDGAGSGLSGFRGVVGGSPGVELLSVSPLGVSEEYAADEKGIVRILREYRVLHRG